MQASKIIPKQVYAIAIKSERGELVRFRVSTVITTQTRTEAKSSPSEYHSVVIGNVAQPGHEPVELRLAPEKILGPYQAYAELEARDAAERQAKDKAEAERKALCKELCDSFYELTRLTRQEVKPYEKHVFDLDYPHGVEIREEGVEPLLAVLRGLVRKVVA